MIAPEPLLLTAETFSRMPDALRKNGEARAWSAIHRFGAPVDSFLEGPCFDAAGDLYVVDIPYGRILRIAADGAWSVAAEYDGWPNGLKFYPDGRLLIADNKLGLLGLDVKTGAVSVLLDSRHGERFKGLNDLTISPGGEVYFTDQGQTGLQDPTGRVYRWSEGLNRLDLLISNVPSPNGLVLDATGRQLYLAATRANAVWRLPLMTDGLPSKAGIFLQLSGGFAGPDGIALDVEGGIVVAHVGIGVWRFDRYGRPTHLVQIPQGDFGTNIAFGGEDNRYLYVTESASGTIVQVKMPFPGAAV
jgi:gluconolactonase